MVQARYKEKLCKNSQMQKWADKSNVQEVKGAEFNDCYLCLYFVKAIRNSSWKSKHYYIFQSSVYKRLRDINFRIQLKEFCPNINMLKCVHVHLG